MKIIRFSSKEIEKLYNRAFWEKKRVKQKAAKIIERVRIEGDEAVIKYTKQFDEIKLSASKLRVTEAETSGAFQNIDSNFIKTLKVAVDNVTKFHRKQLRKSYQIKPEEGVKLTSYFYPIRRVGIYVPAGSSPLVSSVYMTALLARIAGVKEIIMTTPPNKYGTVDPHILVVANLVKVDAVYKVGGAQAIAAMAFGTRTIPRVDKIVGPGNIYVTEAKRQVFGWVDVDMIAGPSEVLIIANQYANPEFVIRDLQAQSEHAGGLAILVTNSKKLAKEVKNKVEAGFVLQVKNLDQACELVNRISPEHVQIMIKSPFKLIKKIKNTGVIFTGSYTPTVVGDYIAGPSHVLPTAGTARFFSGLGIDDFLKKVQVISYSKKALEKNRGYIEQLAKIEGLEKHLESVKVRF